jgi:hypothetical protein
MTRNYQDTKLFDFLRQRVFKIKKPYALEWGQWDKWRTETKRNQPLGYFVTETLPDLLEKPAEWFLDPIYDLRYYVLNRWVTRSHALTAHKQHIRPGEWRDLGDRFLPCMFSELVDFVEVELAWHNCVFDPASRKKFSPPWWRRGWLRWRGWRCPESGLEYLNWASKLVCNEDSGCDPAHAEYGKPTAQALAAAEILDLYQWWTVTRPQRPDPYEASGWTELSTKLWESGDPFSDQRRSPEQQHEVRQSLDQMHLLEAEHAAEDQAQLIRLIKVRNHLWT